jgi:hypothetical protein
VNKLIFQFRVSQTRTFHYQIHLHWTLPETLRWHFFLTFPFCLSKHPYWLRMTTNVLFEFHIRNNSVVWIRACLKKHQSFNCLIVPIKLKR